MQNAPTGQPATVPAASEPSVRADATGDAISAMTAIPVAAAATRNAVRVDRNVVISKYSLVAFIDASSAKWFRAQRSW
ncbi:hypothetical protein GCM10009590_30200 [Brachybacterium alimentarium]